MTNIRFCFLMIFQVIPLKNGMKQRIMTIVGSALGIRPLWEGFEADEIPTDIRGSGGNTYILDSEGRLIDRFYKQDGSVPHPINWRGDGLIDLFLPFHRHGFMVCDSYGTPIEVIKRQSQAYAKIHQLTGDGREQIAICNPHDIRIYVQDRHFNGPTYSPPVIDPANECAMTGYIRYDGIFDES